MSAVIQTETNYFVDNKKSLLNDDLNNNEINIKVYAQQLFNVIDNLSEHFLNNKDKTDLDESNVKDFNIHIKSIEEHVESTISYYNQIIENTMSLEPEDYLKGVIIVENTLKYIKRNEIDNISAWLYGLEIPLADLKVIDIKKFIGIK